MSRIGTRLRLPQPDRSFVEYEVGPPNPFTAPRRPIRSRVALAAAHVVGAQEGMRSIAHLARAFVLADRAHLLDDPELAAHRMRHVLALAGVE